MSGSSAFFHKPELALRRAIELAGIHQEEAALTLLHDVASMLDERWRGAAGRVALHEQQAQRRPRAGGVASF